MEPNYKATKIQSKTTTEKSYVLKWAINKKEKS